MRWKLVTWLTIKATEMSDKLLRKRNHSFNEVDFRQMPQNTMGNKLIKYMDENNISFKSNLVRHDLKHILLGYEMNMTDELRIHAFLIGNRCYNPMAILYLLICISIVPEIIPTLKKDFKRGRNTICLRNIQLEKFIESDLIQCQKLWKL